MNYNGLIFSDVVYWTVVGVVCVVGLVFVIDYYLEKTEKRWRDGE
jgi:hypothetical protein